MSKTGRMTLSKTRTEGTNMSDGKAYIAGQTYSWWQDRLIETADRTIPVGMRVVAGDVIAEKIDALNALIEELELCNARQTAALKELEKHDPNAVAVVLQRFALTEGEIQRYVSPPDTDTEPRDVHEIIAELPNPLKVKAPT